MSDCVTLNRISALPPPPTPVFPHPPPSPSTSSLIVEAKHATSSEQNDATQFWSAFVRPQVRASMQVRAHVSDLPGSVAAAETQIT